MRALRGGCGSAAPSVKEMVNLGGDLCLGFIKNESRGATQTVEMARAAGIDVRVWRIQTSKG